MPGAHCKLTPEETPAALQAFEDYWAMGEARSQRDLAAAYQRQSDSGQPVPTTNARTIAEWSSAHNWQERCKQRIAEEAAEFRAAIRQRTMAHRKRLLAAIEADSTWYVERLKKDRGAILAVDALSLERMTKLYFQLAEEPLADRHEITGAEGGPMRHEHRHSLSLTELIHDDDGRELLFRVWDRLCPPDDDECPAEGSSAGGEPPDSGPGAD